MAAPALLAFVWGGAEAIVADNFRYMADGALRILLFAYALTFFFGLPTFLILRGTQWPTIGRCAVVGSAVAVAPALLGLAVSSPSHAEEAAREWTRLIAGLVIMGAAEGTIFWLVAAVQLTRKHSGA